MTTRRLYNIGISSRSQTRGEQRARQQLAQQGILNEDSGAVTNVASDPDEEQLSLEFAGAYAEQMIAELRELASASGIDAVPYFGVEQQTPADGYYSISTSNAGRRDPRFEEVEFFDGTLARHGTIENRRRAVQTDISQPDHPFGNSQSAYVGIPATATNVRWFDSKPGDVEDATVVGTRSAEFGDVDVYDAEASSFENPELVYRLDYDQEGRVDPRVWDTYGFDTKQDDDDAVRWQTVFSTAHDYVGDAVLENGLVRLTYDRSAPSLTVEEWDDSSGAWTSVAQGDSDWEVFDVDVRGIGLSSITAVVEFRDSTASPTEYYKLSMDLKRGWESPLWSEIDGEGGTPTGLADLLEPVASESAFDPGEDQGLRKRSEL